MSTVPPAGRFPHMSTNPEVDAWFDDYDHPMKEAMLRVREIILEDVESARAEIGAVVAAWCESR